MGRNKVQRNCDRDMCGNRIVAAFVVVLACVAVSISMAQVGSRSGAGAGSQASGSRPGQSASAAAPQNRATPSVRQALQIAPVQKEVEYDTPSPEEIDQCTMESFRSGKQAGWVVRGPDGTILRKFVDSNGDNMVDQWCYFKDGLEVYRDIDSNFNGKADQYRWLHTAGTKWGVDSNEDGRVDFWKMISAEEVTAEIVAALATRDLDRFRTVVLTPAELKALGLGPEKTREIEQRLGAIAEGFRRLANSQSPLPQGARWVQFAGGRPGIVPAGTDGSTQDLRVYENVVTVAEAGQQFVQILVGTLIAVGDTWKVIDVPQILGESPPPVELSGFFFRRRSAETPPTPAQGPSQQVQQLVEQLEKVEQALASATTPAQVASLHQQKADLLERLAQSATTDEERALWIRQLADELSFAIQEGSFPQAQERLERLYQAMLSQGHRGLIAYVRYRQLMGEYGRALTQPGTDYVKLHQEWVQKLEQFAREFGQLAESAEAIFQLAVAHELSGDEEQAKKWYSLLVERFPNAPPAAKASGALRRLGLAGQPLRLRGSTVSGQPFDIAQLQGKVALIYYWASWCEPCRADLPTLKDLLARYGRYGFTIVGVNLDPNPEAMQQFVQEYQVNWPQLYEPGGLESPLANELGIVTVPTLILVDQQGRVVSRNLQTATLESELRRLIR